MPDQPTTTAATPEELEQAAKVWDAVMALPETDDATEGHTVTTETWHYSAPASPEGVGNCLRMIADRLVAENAALVSVINSGDGEKWERVLMATVDLGANDG